MLLPQSSSGSMSAAIDVPGRPLPVPLELPTPRTFRPWQFPSLVDELAALPIPLELPKPPEFSFLPPAISPHSFSGPVDEFAALRTHLFAPETLEV